jgi:hypothetical protein
VQEHCPPEKPFAIRHSLLAAVLTFASRYSLPFPDLPICRLHDLPIRFGSAGISPSHFLPSRKVIHQSLISIRIHYLPFAAVSTAGGQSRLPFATRYSPFATRPSKNFRLQAKARIM